MKDQVFIMYLSLTEQKDNIVGIMKYIYFLFLNSLNVKANLK